MNKENLVTMYEEANKACNYFTQLWLDEDTHEEDMHIWAERLSILDKLIATF